jgi:hypothetical protein
LYQSIHQTVRTENEKENRVPLLCFCVASTYSSSTRRRHDYFSTSEFQQPQCASVSGMSPQHVSLLPVIYCYIWWTCLLEANIFNIFQPERSIIFETALIPDQPARPLAWNRGRLPYCVFSPAPTLVKNNLADITPHCSDALALNYTTPLSIKLPTPTIYPLLPIDSP